MKILRRAIYVFFVLLLFIGFVFFGGGRALICIGETMQRWELSMKETFGGFCQQGEKRIKHRIGTTRNTLSKRIESN